MNHLCIIPNVRQFIHELKEGEKGLTYRRRKKEKEMERSTLILPNVCPIREQHKGAL